MIRLNKIPKFKHLELNSVGILGSSENFNEKNSQLKCILDKFYCAKIRRFNEISNKYHLKISLVWILSPTESLK